MGKESAWKAGDPGSIPGSRRSPGEGNGNPLLYSSWRIPRTEEPGRLQSMGSKRWTQLSKWTTTIFHFCHSGKCIVISHYGFNCIYLITTDAVLLFAICIFFLVKCPYMSFPHFLIRLLYFFLYSFGNSLFWIIYFWQICGLNILCLYSLFLEKHFKTSLLYWDIIDI